MKLSLEHSLTAHYIAVDNAYLPADERLSVLRMCRVRRHRIVSEGGMSKCHTGKEKLFYANKRLFKLVIFSLDNRSIELVRSFSW